MAKRVGAHRIEKRAKELKRLKKQEEKRLRRLGRAEPEPAAEEGGENPESIPGEKAGDAEDGSPAPSSAPA